MCSETYQTRNDAQIEIESGEKGNEVGVTRKSPGNAYYKLEGNHKKNGFSRKSRVELEVKEALFVGTSGFVPVRD